MADLLQSKPVTCAGHSRPVPQIRYSSVIDGQYFIISACLDGKPMLRHGLTGDWIGTYIGHKGAVFAVGLNQEVTRAATGSADYSAKVWNARTGEDLHTFQHPKTVKAVEFSPTDSNRLMTAGQDGIVRLFDIEQPESEPTALCLDEKHHIRCAVFLDEHTVLCGEDSGLITRWDLRSSTSETVKQLSDDGNAIMDLNTSVAGRVLASSKHTVRGVDWRAPDKLLLRVQVDDCEVHSGATLGDSSLLVGGEDLSVRRYELVAGDDGVQTSGGKYSELKGHHGPVHDIRVAPTLDTFASSSEDGTVRLWQVNVGEPLGLWQLMDGHGRCVSLDSLKAEAAATAQT